MPDCPFLTSIFYHIVTCKYSFILSVSFPSYLECVFGGQTFTSSMFLFFFSNYGMCSDSFNISCLSHSLTLLPAMGCSTPSLPSFFPPSLIPHPHVVFVHCAFVGVSSAWDVGGVVVMESVLCDLWAGHQDANQEVCERRWGPGLWTARGSDQSLQHSSVSWLVESPFTQFIQCLLLSLNLSFTSLPIQACVFLLHNILLQFSKSHA